MLSLCFSFKTVGLRPSLLQHSSSPWNNSSFELLVIGTEAFLGSLPGLWSLSGISQGLTQNSTWVRGRNSVPPKRSKRVCVTVWHSSAERFPHTAHRRKLLVQTWGDTRRSQECFQRQLTCPPAGGQALAALEDTWSWTAKAFLQSQGCVLRGDCELTLASQSPGEASVLLHRENYYLWCGVFCASTIL